MLVLFVTLCSLVFAVNVGETAQANLGDSCGDSTGMTCDPSSSICDIFLKQCRIKFFNDCSGNLDKCVTGTQCSSTRCQCIDTAYDLSTLGDTCEPKPGKVNGECISNTCEDINAQCSNNKCVCTASYSVRYSDATCEPKPGKVNGECISNSCEDVNAQCSNNKCVCKDTYSVRYTDATCDYGKRCELKVQNNVSAGNAGNSLTGSGIILISAILCLY